MNYPFFRLLGARTLAASPELLSLEVFVKQVEGLLVASAGTGDGKHALASLVVRGLRDADSRSAGATDLLDLGATTADDAPDHVGGDRDVLGLRLLAILIDGGGGRRAVALSSTRSGHRLATAEGRGSVLEVGSVTGAGVRAGGALGGERDAVANSATDGRAALGADSGVVEDGASAALPVIDKALANLPDGHADGVGVTLDLDDALSRLRKHLLLGDHAGTRHILNVLDLETLATNDGAHLVVRDEEAHGCMWGQKRLMDSKESKTYGAVRGGRQSWC